MRGKCPNCGYRGTPEQVANHLENDETWPTWRIRAWLRSIGSVVEWTYGGWKQPSSTKIN